MTLDIQKNSRKKYAKIAVETEGSYTLNHMLRPAERIQLPSANASSTNTQSGSRSMRDLQVVLKKNMTATMYYEKMQTKASEAMQFETSCGCKACRSAFKHLQR